MTRHFCCATVGVLLLVGLAVPHPVAAQSESGAEAFVRVATGYRLIPNITYHRAGGRDLTLDVYQSRAATEPNATLIYIHGGGWTNGSKEGSALTVLPYLEMGWNVVNVAYRLADAAHAPAAVEDCRCAPAVGLPQRGAVQLRPRPHRGDRQLGGRPPVAHHRHAAGLGGPRPPVSGRPATGLDHGHHVDGRG